MHPRIALLFLVLVAASAMTRGAASTQPGKNSPDSPVSRFEDAVAAAAKTREAAVQAAESQYVASVTDAYHAMQDKRKRELESATIVYDGKIKEATRREDLDKALSIRNEKNRFAKDWKDEDDRLARQFEAMTRPAAPNVSPERARASESAAPAQPAPPPATQAAKPTAVDPVEAVRARVDPLFFREAHPLDTAQLNGDVEWKAAGGPYSLPGVLQIGNSNRNHSGPWASGKVKVEAGYLLNGGTLRVSGGSIEFNGTEEKPVVLREVHLECEFTGTITAHYTIFDRCTFQKAGGWHWNEGYSSKWDFDHCVLNGSSFLGLSRMDYGLKLSGCAFLDCQFPPRRWHYSKADQNTDDGAKLTQSEWSRIDDCDFYRCRLAVSSVWITHGCNFMHCSVGDNETFASETNIEVKLGLTRGDPILGELAEKTESTGAGKVRYTQLRLENTGFRTPLLRGWVGSGSAATSAPHRTLLFGDGE